MYIQAKKKLQYNLIWFLCKPQIILLIELSDGEQNIHCKEQL